MIASRNRMIEPKVFVQNQRMILQQVRLSVLHKYNAAVEETSVQSC